MTNLELLEKYEPVLRFAKSERFFPMAVEPYLERCSIFPDGPQGIVESLVYLQEPLVRRIGKFKSEQFYLRFINKPLNNSDAWIWWGVLSFFGAAGGWFFAGWAGVEFVAAVSLVIALLIFMFASPVRLRIIPAALAALFFITFEIAPIWFFLHPREFISVTVEYLILLPIYLIVLFYLSVRTMKFILDHVIPEGPGMIMDMLSQATEKIARESYLEFSKLLEKTLNPFIMVVFYLKLTIIKTAGQYYNTIFFMHSMIGVWPQMA